MTAKKKAKKGMPLASIIIAALSVLLILTLFLPIATSKGSASLGESSTEGKTYSYTTIDMLAGMGANSDNIGDKSEGAVAAKTMFFANDEKSEAKIYTIFALITFIVGVLGVTVGVISLFFKKVAKYLKWIGLLEALVSIVTFILAIVTASAFSTSASVVITFSTTVSIGIGAILALIGGVLSGVTPFVLKK